MRRLLALLAFLPGLAFAQTGANVNPVPGSLWTYLGPTLGADWVFPAGGAITGSGTAGKLAIWSGANVIEAPIPGSVVTGLYNGPRLVIGNDPSSGYDPNNTTIGATEYVQALGATNGIIGTVNNTVPFATTAFLPVGVTGYGKVPATVASVAFGLYGLGELRNTVGEAVGGEVTSRNFSGAPANNGVPPPLGLPSSSTIADGFHITCGTEIGTADCSTGLYIANESGGGSSFSSFANGEIIQGYRQYGLYVMAQPSGTQISAELDNNGNSINLILKTTLAMSPANSVLEVDDHLGNPVFDVYQNGDVHGNNFIFSGGFPFLPGLTTSGTSGNYVCINSSTGALYQKSACP